MNDAQRNDVVSPPAKRMKQGRLPFFTLTNKPNISSTPSPQITKKPKLVDKASPFLSGTGKVKHGDKHTTPLKKAETLHGKKPSIMKARKIGFSSEVAGKPCAPPEQEVSSSSEDTKPSEKECDSTVETKDCTSTGLPKKVSKTASLDRFVQSTQQPHVSTSAIIDLTDADDEMEDDDDFEPPRKSKAEKRKRESPTESPTGTSTDTGEAPQDNDPAVNTSMSSASSLEHASSDEEGCEASNHSNSVENDKRDTLMEAATSCLEEKGASNNKVKNESMQMPPQPVTPSNQMKPIKKTPMSAKALQRLKEQDQKKEEKQRLREEKKRKLEEENEMKKRLKLEQRKSKEEEKEAQRKQKAEEKKKKEMEKQLKKEKEEQERIEKKKAKEEERMKKQEDIEAKQEEKKKKQEERIKQEEEKKEKEAAELLKKEKQSQAFKSFFSVQAQAPVKKPEVKGWFAPFEVKSDMVLAPCRRVQAKDLDLEQVDKHLKTPSTGSLYLDGLKSGKFKPRKGVRTPGPSRAAQGKDSMDVDVPTTSSDDPASSKKKSKEKKPDGLKMKLLQFHENYRPAYYGTWQKKESGVVTGRNPFKKDEDIFDYEIDSDDEWEEPGESLSHSEGEDEDGDGDDDDEEEDGFFVPHGYLSAGEGGEDEEDTDNLKVRQAAKAKAWENELKRRCEALKPMIVTFIQVASTNKTRQDERKKLEAYQAMPLTNLPIATSFTKREKAKGAEEGANSMEGDATAAQRLAGGMGNKLKPVPEEAMPELLKLVHGNMAGIKSLIREFRDYWRRKQHRLETSSPGAPAASPDGSPSQPAGGQSISARESPLGSASAAGQEASPSPVPGSTTTQSPQFLDHIDHVISKRQLDLKIISIAVRERRPQHFKRICWYVHDHILEKYNLTDLPVPTAWVNGVGARDGQSSPLPPTNIAARPAAAVPKPAVSKPVVVKAPNLHEASLAKQHIYIPSSTMPSAFNKVVGVSNASGAMHLPGTAFQSTAPIGYIHQGGALLQPGLAPIQVVPFPMQQAINPAAFNMSNLLQQAAASSLLANMQHATALGNTLVQPSNTKVQAPNPSLKVPNTNALPGAQQKMPGTVSVPPPQIKVQTPGIAIKKLDTSVLPKTSGSQQNMASSNPVQPSNTTVQTPPTGVESPISNPLPISNGAQQRMPGVAQNSIGQVFDSVKQKQTSPVFKPGVRSPPGSITPSSSAGKFPGSGPSLPSIMKTSPQRLDAAIAKMYESNALLQNKEKTSPVPVKKTKTLTSFFTVQNPKKTDNKPQENPLEAPKE
ncbi:chromatin assembly factor 1 subunit A-like [Lytechinus pictus]|uniref:chromatin assembly factor 1 subunit A-like n=1 Tax=Lytechinus pictus TaxID=7653 RepID=UPI0030B9E895